MGHTRWKGVFWAVPVSIYIKVSRRYCIGQVRGLKWRTEPIEVSSSVIVNEAQEFGGVLTAEASSNETIQWSVNISASLGSITSVMLTWSGTLETTKSRTLFPHVGELLCWIKKWSLRLSTNCCSLAPVEESGQSHGILGRFRSLQISTLSNLLQVSSRNFSNKSIQLKSALGGL